MAAAAGKLGRREVGLIGGEPDTGSLVLGEDSIYGDQGALKGLQVEDG